MADASINNNSDNWDQGLHHPFVIYRQLSAGLLSAALGPRTRSNSNHKSWAGQVDLCLSATGMPCDLSSPQTVSVSAVVEKLQSSYLASVNACSGVKMQQYLSLRSNVDTASYSPAAYLQAVVRWKQRKHLAQLRTGSHWLAVETGRFGVARVERQLRLCQRCEGSSVDDVEHMIFDCCSLEAERQKHQSLFSSACTWKGGFSGLFQAGSNRAGRICSRLFQGTQ